MTRVLSSDSSRTAVNVGDNFSIDKIGDALDYLRAARTLGMPPWAMYDRVIIPAALPSIITGLKLGWTLGWHGAISAELIKSSVGLGFLLYMGRELDDAAQVIGIMILMIVFGLLLDQFLFGLIERKIRHRWRLTAEQDLEH